MIDQALANKMKEISATTDPEKVNECAIKMVELDCVIKDDDSDALADSCNSKHLECLSGGATNLVGFIALTFSLFYMVWLKNIKQLYIKIYLKIKLNK